MNRLCKCGGRLEYLDENAIRFRKRCVECGRTYKQRKRRPKPRKV